MANPNVIDYATFGNYPTQNTNHLRTNFVREEEGEYGDQELLDKIQALLNKPLWPKFPDGVYLNPNQAGRFYRAAQGMQGLAHILDRSAHARDLTKDYDNEPASVLSKLEESQLRISLIELSTELVNLADDLHCRAQ